MKSWNESRRWNSTGFRLGQVERWFGFQQQQESIESSRWVWRTDTKWVHFPVVGAQSSLGWESGRGLPQSKTLRDVSGAGGPAALGLRQPSGALIGVDSRFPEVVA